MELWTYDMLADKIHVKKGTLRNWVSRNVLKKGIHYVKPAGKPLFIPEQIEKFLGLHHIDNNNDKTNNSKKTSNNCRFNL